jgi:catalase
VQHATGRSLALVCGALLGCPPPAIGAEDTTTVEQVQAALEGAYGVNPGQRRNHAKGTCAAGHFVGLPVAAAYTRSPLFSGLISAATKGAGGPCERINFDPLVMSDGVAPTNDPVLLFRSPSYGASFARRQAGR